MVDQRILDGLAAHQNDAPFPEAEIAIPYASVTDVCGAGSLADTHVAKFNSVLQNTNEMIEGRRQQLALNKSPHLDPSLAEEIFQKDLADARQQIVNEKLPLLTETKKALQDTLKRVNASIEANPSPRTLLTRVGAQRTNSEEMARQSALVASVGVASIRTLALQSVSEANPVLGAAVANAIDRLSATERKIVGISSAKLAHIHFGKQHEEFITGLVAIKQKCTKALDQIASLNRPQSVRAGKIGEGTSLSKMAAWLDGYDQNGGKAKPAAAEPTVAAPVRPRISGHGLRNW